MTDVDHLRTLFKGAEGAYGVFVPSGVNVKGKLEGKSHTVKKEITDELWEDHIKGVRGLGIIPIFDKNKCRWGCLDIDVYPSPVDTILKAIKEHNYPLNLCRSKSGGLHVFLFMKEPILASQMRSLLGSLASKLGLDPSVEIFPKQERLGPDGIGNWVNMPFFGKTRLAIGPKEENIPLDKFKAKIADSDELEKALAIIDSRIGPEAPPCLQRMIESGHVRQGLRNIFLANMAVLIRKEGKNGAEGELSRANNLFCLPELDYEEVVRTHKSMANKPYDYQCSQLPYCDHATCIKRKYGIGNSGAYREERITKYEEEDGKFTYEVGIREEDKPMILTEEEYSTQPKYRLKFLSYYDRVPPKMSPTQWDEHLNNRQKLIVFVPLELGTRKLDRFKMLLKRYFNQHRITDKNKIRNDVPGAYVDEHDRINFPKTALREWLISNKLDFTGREIVAFLKEIGESEDVSTNLKYFNGSKHTTVLVYRIPLTSLEDEISKDDSNEEGEPL